MPAELGKFPVYLKGTDVGQAPPEPAWQAESRERLLAQETLLQKRTRESELKRMFPDGRPFEPAFWIWLRRRRLHIDKHRDAWVEEAVLARVRGVISSKVLRHRRRDVETARQYLELSHDAVGYRGK